MNRRPRPLPVEIEAERQPHEPRAHSRKAPGQVTGPDGFVYSQQVDEEINAVLSGSLGHGIGLRAMAYLESITTRRVLGPESTDGHLRHLEGARWLVGVMRQRIAAGQKAK